MTDATGRVRRAGPGDAALLTAILADGFMEDPVSRWLFPDAGNRASRHPAFFRVFVDHAIAHGEAYLTGGDEAAALWLDIGPDGQQPPEIPQAQFAAACGPGLVRFQVLGTLMQACHPHGPAHAYLPFIAVRSHRQGRGIGGSLLRHRLNALDAGGRPAYLEASSARSRRLYERTGFARVPTRIELPDGPDMYPMWRPPSG